MSLAFCLKLLECLKFGSNAYKTFLTKYCLTIIYNVFSPNMSVKVDWVLNPWLVFIYAEKQNKQNDNKQTWNMIVNIKKHKQSKRTLKKIEQEWLLAF